MSSNSTVSVVIPTVGRESLRRLLRTLAASDGPPPAAVFVVDDRPDPSVALAVDADLPGLTVTILRSGGRGPAAARNVGWRQIATEWVAFLDDDVEVSDRWLAELATDLSEAPAQVAGVQGNVQVPLPPDRPPTDWERGTSGLATAKWITADMAVRRRVLQEVGGFDERFTRAYREDTDLALRILDRGYQFGQGRRAISHPPRSATFWASAKQQRGNSDDVLMDRKHGPQWRQRVEQARGRRVFHLLTVGSSIAAAAGVLLQNRPLTALASAANAALIGDLARRRIAPGPRTGSEVARMVATSILIPYAATWHYLSGLVRYRGVDRESIGSSGAGGQAVSLASAPTVTNPAS